MTKLVLLLSGWLLASPSAPPPQPASADSSPPVHTAVSYEQHGPRMAAARVKNWQSGFQRKGPAISGSGTLTAVYGAQGLVLTASHLFEGTIGPITVEFTDGQISGARILAIDHKLDVAALWIYAPKGIHALPIAERDPLIGQQIEIWGYGPKRFRSFEARVSRPIPMSGDPPRTLVAAQGIEDKQVTIPGDSGGPMVWDGKIVGVHWGYRGGEQDPRRCVHAIGCSRLKDWLRAQLDPTIFQRCLALSN